MKISEASVPRFATFAVTLWSPLVIASEAASTDSLFGLGKDFWEKAVIAVVGAVLGFIGNFALALMKKRSDPRKQISFDLQTQPRLVAVEERIQRKVKILYNESEVRDIYSAACNVENTGNTVVKKQVIRFAFPLESQILETFFDPSPERELGVEIANLSELRNNEVSYQVAHLEAGQKVGFRFVIAGSYGEPTLHPFNEEGDVKFLPRAVSVAADHTRRSREFLLFLIMSLLIPQVFYIFPYELGSMAAAAVRLGFLIVLLPRLGSFVHIIAQVLNRLALPHPPDVSVSIRGDASNLIVNSSSQTGGIEIHSEPRR
jgi:hypothetical protein